MVTGGLRGERERRGREGSEERGRGVEGGRREENEERVRVALTLRARARAGGDRGGSETTPLFPAFFDPRVARLAREKLCEKNFLGDGAL